MGHKLEMWPVMILPVRTHAALLQENRLIYGTRASVLRKLAAAEEGRNTLWLQESAPPPRTQTKQRDNIN
jgi:hypothetical protein